MNTTHSRDFVGGLQDAIRENPVSAALIGMGVLWMFTGGSRITAAAAMLPSAARATATGIASGMQSSADAAGTMTEGMRSAASRLADGVRDTVASVANTASETVSNMASTAGQTTSQAYDAVREGVTQATSQSRGAMGDQARSADSMVSTLQDNLKQTFERQPLLLGAIGIAIGAGMAAAVPRTQIEAEYVGDTADEVKAQMKEFASAQVDRATAAAGRTIEAVKEEVVTQGLTPKGAKEGAAAMGEKLKNVAQAARGKTAEGR